MQADTKVTLESIHKAVDELEKRENQSHCEQLSIHQHQLHPQRRGLHDFSQEEIPAREGLQPDRGPLDLLDADLHNIDLGTLDYDPTAQPASDLQKYPSILQNQLPTYDRGVIGSLGQSKDTKWRRKASPESKATVTQVYRCDYPGCESSFSGPYFLK